MGWEARGTPHADRSVITDPKADSEWVSDLQPSVETVKGQMPCIYFILYSVSTIAQVCAIPTCSEASGK